MNDSLPEQNHRSRTGLRWAFELLILAVAGAVAWLLAVYVDSPMVATFVAIAAIGWVLHRLAHASTAGIILWCVAAVAMSVVYWVPIPDAPGELKMLCRMTGLFFTLASSIVFLVAAAKDRARRAANCGGCVLAMFTLIVCGASAAMIRSRLDQQERIQQTAQTIIKLHRLAAEIEAIRARLGRLPKDEEELVRLRGKPMPLYRRNFRVRYYALEKDDYRYHGLGKGDYCLDCGMSNFWGRHWDLFPWIFHYYGPYSPQRLHAEVF